MHACFASPSATSHAHPQNAINDGNTTQGLLERLVAAANAEREALSRERAQLLAERRALEQERSRVQQVLCDSEQVTLNVGGHRFTTTVSTLRNAPASLFSAMFSGRHELQRAEDGSIFIDRDGGWLRPAAR